MSGEIRSPDGHYPGLDVLSQAGHWDSATRRLIFDRVYNVPPIRFFNAPELEALQAAIDILMPQFDRPAERRIPVASYIDEGQHKGESPGFRYEDMPDGRTSWHWGLEGIDQTGRALFGRRFVELGPGAQRDVLRRIQQGNAPGEVWQRMPAGRFFTTTLMGGILSAYYAHPYSWDEIGYGGPAYPRGYYALNFGVQEHWEVPERA